MGDIDTTAGERECDGTRHCPKHHPATPDAEVGTGLEARYLVRKLNDRAGKHNECRYFVLDPKHDPIARQALTTYADDPDCPPALSRDLWALLTEANAAVRESVVAEQIGLTDTERVALGSRLHADGFYAPAVKVRIAQIFDDLLRDRADRIEARP